MLPWILFFSVAGSVGVIGVASMFLWLSPARRERVIPALLSFATGTLLGAAFLGLIPHALESRHDSHPILLAVLGGILVFFVMEKLVLWHHCHHDEACVDHLGERALSLGGHGHPEHGHSHGHGHPGRKAAGSLILIGDSAHKFVDGIVIAVGFMASFNLGVTTALAVVAHEIPHTVGDFAILLKSGFSPRRALAATFFFALSSVVGALAAYFALRSVQAAVPYLMAFSAASFIYIAISDLVPGLHKYASARESVLQTLLIVAGIAVIATLHSGHSH